MSQYLIKPPASDDDYRRVYRIESETDTHYTVTSPFFTHFGSKFSSFRQQKDITKKWLNSRNFVKMDRALADKYDNIRQYEDTDKLFD